MIIKKMSEGRAFDMGKGDSRNVFGPQDGAKHITFNWSRFEPGQAFKQHIHPHSEDVIIVLEGDGLVKLDDDEFPIEAGNVILVSEGEYHGTVAGPNGMVACSCQAPIDAKLFEGGTQPSE